MSDPVILEKNTCLPLAERLVVLMPEYALDFPMLGRIVRDLAWRHVKTVLFLCVVREPFASIHMQHVLSFLAAVIHDPFLHVDTDIQVETTWKQAIKSVSRPGDIFVVLSDHKIRQWIFWREALADLVTRQFDYPVYVLPVSNGVTDNRMHKVKEIHE